MSMLHMMGYRAFLYPVNTSVMYCNVMVHVGLWVNKHDKIGFYKSLPKHLQNLQYVVLIESLFHKVHHVVPDNCLPRRFEISCPHGGH